MKTEKTVTITDSEYYYTAGYYVTNKWIDNDSFVGIRFTDEAEMKNEIVKISLLDNSIEVITDDVKCTGFITVKNNKLYYINSKGFSEYDFETKNERLICEFEGEGPKMTADGKYASLYKVRDDEPSKFYRVNIETCECELVYEKMFAKPLPVANHLMISPTDKDMFFFAHEGETFYISNRLWLYNDKTKKAWNIAKQTLNQDGNLGDCFGHEMWAPDGKGLYFVKYACSPEPPFGVCYVDIETGKYELLYSNYKYWHVGVSQDGRYLIVDTQYAPKQSEVVIIDTKTGEEFVADMPYMTAIHPCHPHPQMSPDNSKVIYTALDKENGRTCIKISYIKH